MFLLFEFVLMYPVLRHLVWYTYILGLSHVDLQNIHHYVLS